MTASSGCPPVGGNVDTDLVFKAMRDSIKEEELEKVVIVSGDGDYRKMIDYFIEEGRFLKLLAPNGRYSSLYRDIMQSYISNLSSDLLRHKLEFEPKVKGRLKSKPTQKKWGGRL